MEKVRTFAEDTAQAGQLLRAESPDWAHVRWLLVEPTRWLSALTETDKTHIEPFLLAAATEAIAAAWVALEEKDRTQARLAVERLRQALNDIAEAADVGSTRDPAEVVAWIEQLAPDAPAAQLGALVGVSDRTWQRWVSETGVRNGPSGEHADRVRVLAQALAHLRHSYTPAGCLAWLERPNPQLDGQRPADVLADDLRARDAIDLAAGTRVLTAT